MDPLVRDRELDGRLDRLARLDPQADAPALRLAGKDVPERRIALVRPCRRLPVRHARLAAAGKPA